MLGWLLIGSLAVLPSPGPEVRKFLRVSTSRVVLKHVEIIDGTGAPPLPDRNVTIEKGKIAAITAGADERATEGTMVLDLRGGSVLPGLVGLHDHLFYLARPGYGADGSFVEIVFQDGLGYDSRKLLDSVEGHYGEY